MRFLRRLLIAAPNAKPDHRLSGRLFSARMGRRSVFALGAATLAGCVTEDGTSGPLLSSSTTQSAARPGPSIYDAVSDNGYQIPAVDVAQVDQRYWRTDVVYSTKEKPGTLIVDTPNKYLYHVLSEGRATRYGVGVGREGFEWSGRAVVAYSRQWPRWVPPDSMMQRQPELKRYSANNGGMQPGLRNPLGARALYIHENGRDTLYRLHGTSEPDSIGMAVSSGCIRLLNQDVIHLYNNVRNGTPIVVIPDPSMSPTRLSTI